MQVFIADESPIMRKRLTETLSGFENLEIVGEAREAVQAIKSIQRLKPDVVILAVQMSGGSGLDVLQAVKKDEDTPVIIMFSNYPEYRKKCLDEGAEYFFEKSTELDGMIETLEKLIDDFSASGGPHQGARKI